MANAPQWPAASHACNHVISLADDDGCQIDKDTEEYFESFPPGYRFCPTDYELIVHYLNKKIKNQKLPRNKMHEVNIYRYSPEYISGIYPAWGEKEWYFFTPRDRKYANGTRPNRAAGTGYWKATGADKMIRDHNHHTIGYRKALVFYEGRPPKGEKTSWIMHEYRVNALPRQKSCAADMRLDDYVLCRIYKNDKSSKSQQKNLLPIQPIVQSQNIEENHSQAQSDSHKVLDDMDNQVEEVYRDYSQPVLLQGISQLGGDNLFQSFGHGLEQSGLPNHVEEVYRDYDQPISLQGISQLGGDNLFQSFGYGLEQSSLPNHVEEVYRDYSQPISHQEISQLGGDNLFQCFGYGLEQSGLPNPIGNKWPDMNPKDYQYDQTGFLNSLPVPTSIPTWALPMTNVPTSIPTSVLPMANVSCLDYPSWEYFKEQTQEDDILNQICFVEQEANLDAVLGTNSPTSFGCPPPLKRKRRD